MKAKKTAPKKTVQHSFKMHDIKIPPKPMFLSASEFLAYVQILDNDAKQSLMEQMRKERVFYNNVLKEDYRAKNPHSYRYVEAETLLGRLNPNGKALKQILES
jgi:hypothetical protein